MTAATPPGNPRKELGAIAKNVMDVPGYGEESVSVAMKEIEARDWAENVYKPDIMNNPDQIYKKPGYDLSELP